LEAIQKNLLWRFQNLWPLEAPRSIPNLHTLPVHIRDPLGRPILVLRHNPIDASASNKQTVVIRALERLRLHLKQLYDDSGDDDPILQYVVLLDLSELSFQSIVRLLFNKFHKSVLTLKGTPGYQPIRMDSKRACPPISWNDRGR
jgi:retinaldehyde-binding protein 1